MIRVAALAVLSCMASQAATHAVVIGISEYSKLPRDLWLQYAEADASAFAELLGSGSLGAVSDLRIAKGSEATLEKIRAGFQSLLAAGAGKDDTVYVFIAAHGTVDATGAYILAYGSDPADLAGTALPMAELHSLVEALAARAGHVVLFADVCRAAAIAGTKTTAIGAVVEKIGDARGELLGLMAARPTELSREGPEFGGGHGAFTHAVLRGLEGAADSDHDGSVTAGELIDFVSADVTKTTGGKQHPRDFGDMENATQLSSYGSAHPH